MRKFLARALAVVMIGGVSCFGVVSVLGQGALAACSDDQIEKGCATTVLLGGSSGCFCGGTEGILALVLKILIYLIAVLGAFGIVYSGFLYLTAGGNAQQVIKAKNRLFQVIIGLIAYGLMVAFLNWIVPGGVL